MAKQRFVGPNGQIYEITRIDDPVTDVQPFKETRIPVRNDLGGVSWATRRQLGLPPDLSGVPRAAPDQGSSLGSVGQLLQQLAAPRIAPQSGPLSAPTVGSLMSDPRGSLMPSSQQGLLAAAAAPQAPRGAPPLPAPAARAQLDRSSFTDDDTNLLARLIFAEGAGKFRVPGVYLGIGNAILNRVGKPGFRNTLQDVVQQRVQFQSVGGDLWNKAGNPAGLTGDNATAYAAALQMARDLVEGGEYVFDDPTGGATYFYSTKNGSPPDGFFTRNTNSGRLQETYRGRKVSPEPDDPEYRFLRDTQQ